MSPTFTIDGRKATEAEARASWRARAMHNSGILASEATAIFDSVLAGSEYWHMQMFDAGIVVTP